MDIFSYLLGRKYKDSNTGSGGGASITSNIKITSNKDDILGTTEHNKLCILSETSDLSFKVVDKIEGGIEDVSMLSKSLPQKLRSSCCARYNVYTYIFGGYNGTALNTIYKFNNITKETTLLETVLPSKIANNCCATFGDYIYIFGASNEKIYKFDCVNETIKTLNVSFDKHLGSSCCASYGDYIYIFGGGGYVSGQGTQVYNTIYRFNCINDSMMLLSTSLPSLLYQACCASYGDYIYIFGGNNKSTNLNSIYKFNCVNESITTLSTTLPSVVYNSCCDVYNNYIYIFYNMNVYKFNCINDTIETITTKLVYSSLNSCCSIFNDKIYIFGGYSGDYLNTILDFSITFNLDLNNVLIYNSNSNYSFDLITDQVTIPIKKVYIGDSNNTAQLASAYLYDQSKSAWVNVNTGEVLS